MTETKHAEVTQEHRELFKDIRWAKVKDPEGRPQLIADYSAEVERKARLDEATCADTHDYDAVPHRAVNPIGSCSQCGRIAELGGD